MNPEPVFTPTPSMSLATANSLPSGSISIPRVDFYQPQADSPRLMDIANTGETISVSDMIRADFDNMIKGIANKPYNKFSMMNNPLKTPLSETLRYQDSNLGGYNYDDPRQEYKYGEAQGVMDSIYSRGMQTVGNFTSAFLGSFTDIPSIISAGIDYKNSSNEGLDRAMDAYKGLFDNVTSNTLDDFNKSILDNNLTYDTEYSEKHPFLSLKIVGDIFASSGYAIGSMAGMLAEDALVGAATAGTALAPLLGTQAAKLGAKFLKVLNSGDTARNTLKTALKAGQDASKALDLAYTTSKIQKGAFGLNMYTNNIFESSIEAKQAQEETEAKLTNEFKVKEGRDPTLNDLVQIKQAANNVANWTFFGNMGLLALTNKIEFGDIIKRMQVGKEAFDYTEKGLARIVTDGGMDNLKIVNQVQDAAKATTRAGRIIDSIKSGAENAGGYVRSSIGESIEEGGQFAIGNATEDYYTQKYNQGGLNSSLSWFKSLGKALGETVTTTEGWMNMIAGLGGGVLIGGVRHAAGLDPKPKEIDREALVGKLTEFKLSSIIEGMGTKINEHINGVAIQGKLNTVKDWYSHQSNVHAQTFNWALSALKGRNDYLAIRQEQLKTAKELQGEDFKTMFGVDDTDINRSRVHESLDLISADLATIKGNFDRVNAIYKNPYGFTKDPKREDIGKYLQYEAYKDELIYHLSKQEKNQSLVKNLDDTIRNINTSITEDFVQDVSTKSGLELKDSNKADPFFISKKGKEEGIAKVREQLIKNQKELEDAVKTGVASEEDKKRKENADKYLERVEKVLAGWEGDEDQKELTEFVKDLYNENSKNIPDAKPMTNLDVKQLLALGFERAKVKASTERSLKLLNLLGSKKGFETFLDLEQVASNRHAKNLAVETENISVPNEKDTEVIDSETVKAFTRTGRIPEEKKEEVFTHINGKLGKIKLTEIEAKIYAKYKTDIDAIGKEAPIEEEDLPEETLEPIVDPVSGLKEGDVLKSVLTKESLTIKKFEKNTRGEINFVLLTKSDGKDIRMQKALFDTNVANELYTLTGEITTENYTEAELKSLWNKYDHTFLTEFGNNHGGARDTIENETSLGTMVIPSNLDLMGDKGPVVLPVILTKKGVKALLEHDKGKKEPEPKTDWIYAGRPLDPADKRTDLDIAVQYELDEDQQFDLTTGLKEVINSVWATPSEQAIARYILPFIPIGTTVKVTKDRTLFNPKTGIEIGLDMLTQSPMEIMLVHEALHLVTHKALKENKLFKARIKNIYEDAKAEAKKQGLENKFRGLEEKDNVLDEFIIEGLTNQEFMKFLGSIREPNQIKSLFRAFIDAVQKLLNIKTDDSLLEYMSDLVFAEIENFNSRNAMAGETVGMIFDPATIFSKIATRGVPVNPNILVLRDQGNLNADYILKDLNLSFRIETPKNQDGTIATVPEGYTVFKYPDGKGGTIKFDKLVKRSPDRVIEVYVDGQQIGIFQPISTWGFKRGDGIVPLTELTESEYVDVTGNNLVTYQAFMDLINAHTQLEEKIVSGKPVGDLKNSLSITTSVGPLAIERNESKRPTVSELEASFPEFEGKKTPFIVSISTAYDEASGTRIPRAIGYLTTMPDNARVYELVKGYVEKNLTKLSSLQARYLTVVSKTGQWESEDDLDFIIAHPKEMNAKEKSSLLEIIKTTLHDTPVARTVGIENYYIADTEGKREISFVIKDGLLFFAVKNPSDTKATYSKAITEEDLKNITFDKFVALVNERTADKGIKPIVAKDFKVDIKDDVDVNPEVLVTQLKSATTTAIRHPVVSIQGKLNLVNPRGNNANQIGTTVPVTEPPKQKTRADFDLAAMNEESYDELGFDVDEEPIVTSLGGNNTSSGELSAKAKAAQNAAKGKKGFKYEVGPQVSQEQIDLHKKVCGS